MLSFLRETNWTLSGICLKVILFIWVSNTAVKEIFENWSTRNHFKPFNWYQNLCQNQSINIDEYNPFWYL